MGAPSSDNIPSTSTSTSRMASQEQLGPERKGHFLSHLLNHGGGTSSKPRCFPPSGKHGPSETSLPSGQQPPAEGAGERQVGRQAAHSTPT